MARKTIPDRWHKIMDGLSDEEVLETARGQSWMMTGNRERRPLRFTEIGEEQDLIDEVRRRVRTNIHADLYRIQNPSDAVIAEKICETIMRVAEMMCAEASAENVTRRRFRNT